jgi:hypothetical protein
LEVNKSAIPEAATGATSQSPIEKLDELFSK